MPKPTVGSTPQNPTPQWAGHRRLNSVVGWTSQSLNSAVSVTLQSLDSAVSVTLQSIDSAVGRTLQSLDFTMGRTSIFLKLVCFLNFVFFFV